MDDERTGTTGFDEFYRAFQGRVRAQATYRFGENAADDIAQEVMLRAHDNLERLSAMDDPWPWLAVVTRNVGVNHARKARRSVPMDLDGLESFVLPVADGPAAAAEASDTRRRLGRALSRLGEHDRRVLQMREIDGLRIVDIASRHGSSAGAIRQRLFRARQVLAREYEAIGGERLVHPAWTATGARLGSATRHVAETVSALPSPVREGGGAGVALLLALVLGAGAFSSTPPPGSGVPAVPALRDPEAVDGTTGPLDALRPRRTATGTLRAILPVEAGCPRYGAAMAGRYLSIALRTDRTVWTWSEDTPALQTARRVPGLPAVASVAAGWQHFLAVDERGDLWGWGDNPKGQVGDGTTAIRPRPVHVLSGVRTVSAGERRSLALRSDGTVWTWGEGLTLEPVPVRGLDQVVGIAAGDRHSLALRADGTVWAWGSNAAGQLGDGTTVDRTTPSRIAGLDRVTAVAAGTRHSLALRADGTVWGWGGNENGQLGDRTFDDRSSASPVSGVDNVTMIAANGRSSLALTADGMVWAWGTTSPGLVEPNPDALLSEPRPVQGLADVRAIVAGATHSLAIENGGRLRRWGYAVTGGIDRPECDQPNVPYALTGTCVMSSSAIVSNRVAGVERCDGGTKGVTAENGVMDDGVVDADP